MNVTDTAFIFLCTILVFLMIPGLAFFYGGLVDGKNVVSVKLQSFVSLGISTILWYICGYSLCFSGDVLGIIGNLDKAFLIGIGAGDLVPETGLPVIMFIMFQLMFAVITPALITGAFTHRITFKSYLIFLVGWQFVVYYPLVHMLWGGGILSQLGVLDFAGGIVVHISAGMAALAAVLFVGSRADTKLKPHNIPLFALGTALLWFGWFGFNAGSALAMDVVAVQAFINTHVAAAVAATTWLVIEWLQTGKPKAVGFLTGSIAGLATITPAAGFVETYAAFIMGILAGSGCYAAVALKNKLGWDDALDVWGVHGVGGIIGTICLGIFANRLVNAAGANGLLYGDSSFFFIQLLAVLATAIYAFVITYLLLKIIDKITPVKVESAEQIELDAVMHGEQAYIKD
jgi:ammonium transporter, Amt family